MADKSSSGGRRRMGMKPSRLLSISIAGILAFFVGMIAVRIVLAVFFGNNDPLVVAYEDAWATPIQYGDTVPWYDTHGYYFNFWYYAEHFNELRDTTHLLADECFSIFRDFANTDWSNGMNWLAAFVYIVNFILGLIKLVFGYPIMLFCYLMGWWSLDFINGLVGFLSVLKIPTPAEQTEDAISWAVPIATFILETFFGYGHSNSKPTGYYN